MAISVTNHILIAAVSVLIFFQLIGMQLAAMNKGPRAYYLMSTIPGLFAAVMVLLYGPQFL